MEPLNIRGPGVGQMLDLLAAVQVRTEAREKQEEQELANLLSNILEMQKIGNHDATD